jgi:hypothetical protein
MALQLSEQVSPWRVEPVSSPCTCQLGGQPLNLAPLSYGHLQGAF